MKSFRIAAVVATVVALVVTPPRSVGADPDAAVVTGTGTTGALWVPGAGHTIPDLEPKTVGWTMDSTAPSVGQLHGAGMLTGWCGYSTGTGVVTLVNLSLHHSPVTWL